MKVSKIALIAVSVAATSPVFAEGGSDIATQLATGITFTAMNGVLVTLGTGILAITKGKAAFNLVRGLISKAK